MALTLRTRDGNLAHFPPSLFCFLEAKRAAGNENSAGSKDERFHRSPTPAASVRSRDCVANFLARKSHGVTEFRPFYSAKLRWGEFARHREQVFFFIAFNFEFLQVIMKAVIMRLRIPSCITRLKRARTQDVLYVHVQYYTMYCRWGAEN